MFIATTYRESRRRLPLCRDLHGQSERRGKAEKTPTGRATAPMYSPPDPWTETATRDFVLHSPSKSLISLIGRDSRGLQNSDGNGPDLSHFRGFVALRTYRGLRDRDEWERRDERRPGDRDLDRERPRDRDVDRDRLDGANKEIAISFQIARWLSWNSFRVS
jgi:hypothetical protein